jgi:calcineurin-like phosphoesterase family protein
LAWFFTSDLHFGHRNIIQYTHRPFETVEQMDDHLIRMWNATVRGRDNVVHAGDLTLDHDPERVRYNYIRYLNGNIIFLKGNHDYWLKSAVEKRYLYHKKINGHFVAVGHFPMRSWQGKRKGGWNLHGHSHALLPPEPKQIDIGVDSAALILGQYRPFHFDEIKYLMEVK